MGAAGTEVPARAPELPRGRAHRPPVHWACTRQDAPHFDRLTGARRFVVLARRPSPDESSASDHGHSTAWGTDAVQRRVHRAHGGRRQQRALQLMVSRKRGSRKEHADMRPAGGEAPRPPRSAHAAVP